jgi:putative protein kinase ArgK-like GTPase of G3E family
VTSLLITGMSGTGKSTALDELLRATCTHELDASRPLDDVVDALVAIGQSAKN